MKTTIKKNFVFDERVVAHLEELSKERNQSMTTVIQTMIEEEYKKIRVKKRLKLLEQMCGSADTLLTGKTVQSIKAEMDV